MPDVKTMDQLAISHLAISRFAFSHLASWSNFFTFYNLRAPVKSNKKSIVNQFIFIGSIQNSTSILKTIFQVTYHVSY